MNGWAFYDWANSVYNLVITSTIFPIYYAANAIHDTRMVDGKEQNYVNFFGREFINEELYSYVMSFSALIILLLLPFLSGVADYKGTKKRYLQFFCYLGSAACISLYWFDPNHLEISMLSVFLASIGFWGSLVFYNAYLPDIATPDMHDKLSAKGFSMGYLGSVLLLVAILVAHKGFDMPIKYGFLAVGVWWAGFAQITYARLPSDIYGRRNKIDMEKPQIYKGFQELLKVFKELRQHQVLKRFLLAFFTYNMGVQTVMILAVLFAGKEVDWPLGEDGLPDKSGLMISILLIQLVAIIGATLMARLSKRVGNINVLRIAIIVWILVCVDAYFIHKPWEFYILACVVGFVMGGIQSMSRSTYAKLLPKTEDTTSYFSFYDSLEKVGLAIGPFMFGFVAGLAQGMRPSVLVLMAFFIIGFALLFFVKPNFRITEYTDTSDKPVTI